eukprot:CAMPEP_0113935230 /NCGR_PEP_ID=MMETSP1339-20121228/2415_1 /TAXON_ID=94617 /ORGANISM="Fibrocapsa japonica" /LENGTH=274 /DNA_ID=CAMNT_0000937301 /DNA_START=205 /DNA_END=1029 /DNA_ORIENTATION=- /assembly_acc=CAM_ASM_000762
MPRGEDENGDEEVKPEQPSAQNVGDEPNPTTTPRRVSPNKGIDARRGQRKKYKKDRVYKKGDSANAVPLDQQPAQELANLKEAPLFAWAQRDDFLLRIALVYAFFFGPISYPIAQVSYPYPDQLVERIASANVGAVIATVALVLRLYVGWSYIGEKLEQDTVYYEKGGWYDGAQWVKPPDVRFKDQLRAEEEVKPVVARLKKVLLGCAVLAVASLLAFKFLSAGDYDPYDPKYLETLTIDDKAAEIAAEKARGKPAYCGSRYYKALSGGAPGCD